MEVENQRAEGSLKREDEKVRRLEVEKVEERDGWMNRMIPAGLDGKKQTAEGSLKREDEKVRRLKSGMVG